MTKVTRDYLVHIADQARLTLSDEELAHYETELNGVLAFTDKINEINTDGVTPTTNGTALTNVLREDTPIKWDKRDEALEHAPDHEDGHFKVPAIMD